MIVPDYQGGSLVNLMSSLLESFGVGSRYESSGRYDLGDNVVLVVVDGLGYEYLRGKGKDNFLYSCLEGKLTSVFPSSTPSAISTFYTGLAPREHGVTGWYTWLKELGAVSTILPFKPRFGEESFDVDIGSVLSGNSLFDEVARDCCHVTLDKLKGSKFNSLFGSGFETYGYSSLDEMFDLLERVVRSDGKKFVLSYWNGVDSAAHDEGVESVATSNEFLEVDIRIRDFVEEVKDTDTTLIVTSDHGLIDTEEEKAVKLEDHPRLEECVRLPLCGDRRTVFCYVKCSKEEEFVNYWEDNLKDFCRLYKSEELVSEGWFGFYEGDQRFYDRIGDYTLVMKEDHVLYDTIVGEEDNFMIGNHGGVSSEEMYVPLCVV